MIRLPVGVRDFLPRAAARRRAIAEALLAEFERWGYDRIITPAFEYLDVLERGLGTDARATALRFVEPATGEVVALRPDITPQVARLAATRLAETDGPIRLCYEGSVLRLQPGARGQRELIQAGVELIDAPSPDGDAEAIALASAAMAAAGLDEAVLSVGHVGVARSALGGLDAALAAELGERIGKKDRLGVAALAAGARLPPRRRKLLEALPELYGPPAEVLRRARALPLDAAAKRAVDELSRALELASSHDLAAALTVDLGELRGFDYYTGLRLHGYAQGPGDALLAGGRYDDLLARFGRPARAVGFAVDVEAVAESQKAREARDGQLGPRGRGALVADLSGSNGRAFRVARGLRAAGVRAAVDLASRRREEDVLAYARTARVRAAVVLDGRRARILPVDGPARSIDAQTLSAALGGDARRLAKELA
jgi:ATP phosphoribosyltransferase regulatory subunit